MAVIIDLCIALIQACVETRPLLCNSFISLAHTCLFFSSFDLAYLQDEHLSYFALLSFFCCQSSRCSFQIAFILHYSFWVLSTFLSIFILLFTFYTSQVPEPSICQKCLLLFVCGYFPLKLGLSKSTW